MEKNGFLQFFLRKKSKNPFLLFKKRRARVASAFGYGDARVAGRRAAGAPSVSDSHPAPAPSRARSAPSIGRSPIMRAHQREASAIPRIAHQGAARVYRDAPRRGKKKKFPRPLLSATLRQGAPAPKNFSLGIPAENYRKNPKKI